MLGIIALVFSLATAIGIVELFTEWLIRRDDAVLARVVRHFRPKIYNPDARNYYEAPFVAMIDSGTFWRCPHGETRFGNGCRGCAAAKPMTYLRTRFRSR